MKLRKNDNVLIFKGKYRGKTGKIVKVFPKENKVVVDGVNIVKKHTRPRRTGEKGKILEVPAPFSVANVKLICKKCKQPTRIGYKIRKSKEPDQKPIKVRICKKCNKTT